MILIAYFLCFLIFLLVCFFISFIARKSGIKKSWKAGFSVFILVMVMIFWDWPFMEVSYGYHCRKDGRFTEFKTLKQWKKENPGVWDTLYPLNDRSTLKINDGIIIMLNDRFAWDSSSKKLGFHIVEESQKIIDIDTNEVLAQYIDFRTDILPLGVGAGEISAYKFWLRKRSCEAKISDLRKREMYNFISFRNSIIEK